MQTPVHTYPVFTTYDLLEDPVNFEPFTDPVRCPHIPGHVYEHSTVLKVFFNNLELWQCSLTNEWFPANKFKRDSFALEASLAIQKIHSFYLQATEENCKLKEEKRQLETDKLKLTEELQQIETDKLKLTEELQKEKAKQANYANKRIKVKK